MNNQEAVDIPIAVKFVEPSVVWLDGEVMSYREASVALMTHSLHYGTGAFEGIRFYWNGNAPVIFRLREHIDRFFHSASAIHMEFPFTPAHLQIAIRYLVRRCGMQEGYIRPFCYYSAGLGVSEHSLTAHVGIVVLPWTQKSSDEGIRLTVVGTRRLHPETFVSSAKVSGYYFNSFLAGREAQAKGFDDALLLDTEGKVAEASAANVFLVRESKVIAVASASILKGITRDTIMQVARNEHFAVEESSVSVGDLRTADEVFLTGTAYEVRPVERIDELFKTRGDGSVTQYLRKIYRNIVTGKNQFYSKWLTEC